MSDGPGSGRNYWQMASKELEEEKQVLMQQVAALTTKRDNLAALVAEMRKALVEFARVGNWWKNAQIPAPRNSGNIFPIEGHVWNDGREPWRIAQQALARSPEQAGAQARAEREIVKAAERWVRAVKAYQKREKNTLTRQIELADECDIAAQWLQQKVDALAALEVQGAE